MSSPLCSVQMQFGFMSQVRESLVLFCSRLGQMGGGGPPGDHEVRLRVHDEDLRETGGTPR